MCGAWSFESREKFLEEGSDRYALSLSFNDRGCYPTVVNAHLI